MRTIAVILGVVAVIILAGLSPRWGITDRRSATLETVRLLTVHNSEPDEGCQRDRSEQAYKAD
jgi:hypothetical protein